jgi:hypothetical protein
VDIIIAVTGDSPKTAGENKMTELAKQYGQSVPEIHGLIAGLLSPDDILMQFKEDLDKVAAAKDNVEAISNKVKDNPRLFVDLVAAICEHAAAMEAVLMHNKNNLMNFAGLFSPEQKETLVSYCKSLDDAMNFKIDPKIFPLGNMVFRKFFEAHVEDTLSCLNIKIFFEALKNLEAFKNTHLWDWTEPPPAQQFPRPRRSLHYRET